MFVLEVRDDSSLLIGEVVEEIGTDELAVGVTSGTALPCVWVGRPKIGASPENPEGGAEGEAAGDGSGEVAATESAVGEDDEERSGEGCDNEFCVQVFRGGRGDVADILHHGEDARVEGLFERRVHADIGYGVDGGDDGDGLEGEQESTLPVFVSGQFAI